MGARRVLVGEIGRPHGVRGLVKLRSFTADPAAIAEYGPLTDETGTRRLALTLLGALGALDLLVLDVDAVLDALALGQLGLDPIGRHVPVEQVEAIDQPDVLLVLSLLRLRARSILGQGGGGEEEGAQAGEATHGRSIPATRRLARHVSEASSARSSAAARPANHGARGRRPGGLARGKP